jgi:hypothetical protein
VTSDALTALDERELLCLARDATTSLRVLCVRGTAPNGVRLTWHEIRVDRRAQMGGWIAGQGVTVRGGELRAVVAELARRAR